MKLRIRINFVISSSYIPEKVPIKSRYILLGGLTHGAEEN